MLSRTRSLTSPLRLPSPLLPLWCSATREDHPGVYVAQTSCDKSCPTLSHTGCITQLGPRHPKSPPSSCLRTLPKQPKPTEAHPKSSTGIPSHRSTLTTATTQRPPVEVYYISTTSNCSISRTTSALHQIVATVEPHQPTPLTRLDRVYQ